MGSLANGRTCLLGEAYRHHSPFQVLHQERFHALRTEVRKITGQHVIEQDGRDSCGVGL